MFEQKKCVDFFVMIFSLFPFQLKFYCSKIIFNWRNLEYFYSGSHRIVMVSNYFDDCLSLMVVVGVEIIPKYIDVAFQPNVAYQNWRRSAYYFWTKLK